MDRTCFWACHKNHYSLHREDGALEVPDKTGQFHLDSELVYTVQGDARPGSSNMTSCTLDRPGPSGTSGLSNLPTSLLPFGAVPYQTLSGPVSSTKKRFSLKLKISEFTNNSENAETWRKSIELHYYHKGSLIKSTNYPLILNSIRHHLFQMTSMQKSQLNVIPERI